MSQRAAASCPALRRNDNSLFAFLPHMKLIPIGRRILAIAPLAALSGCGLTHFPVLAPHGIIALAERNLMFEVIGLMLIVAVPVFVLTFLFVRRYRASNTGGRYMPEWSYSLRLELLIWLVPTLIVAAIAYLVWSSTHTLDPYKSIARQDPLKVQVVSEDWKWLFIYPAQHIATVNELVIPSNRPVRLMLTSDTVMDSFYIPGLVGQIYTMAGMRTQLNMRADGPVDLIGRNTQYSGRGFADQRFTVHATTKKGFDAWVAKVRRSPHRLDAATYAALAKPSTNVPVTYYASVEPGLFDHIIAEFKGPPARQKVALAAHAPVRSEGH